MNKFILGSSSLRRQLLFSEIIENFSVMSPNIDETVFELELPYDYVKRMSYEKLLSIINIEARYPILCADTIVTLNNEILGKPANFDDAVCTLAKLSTYTHEVITSISVFNPNRKDISSSCETTKVKFKELSTEDITQYLSRINWQDKAGSYAIQEDDSIIEHIDGSLSNVIGLPIELTFRLLIEDGLLLEYGLL